MRIYWAVPHLEDFLCWYTVYRSAFSTSGHKASLSTAEVGEVSFTIVLEQKEISARFSTLNKRFKYEKVHLHLMTRILATLKNHWILHAMVEQCAHDNAATSGNQTPDISTICCSPPSLSPTTTTEELPQTPSVTYIQLISWHFLLPHQPASSSKIALYTLSLSLSDRAKRLISWSADKEWNNKQYTVSIS